MILISGWRTSVAASRDVGKCPKFFRECVGEHELQSPAVALAQAGLQRVVPVRTLRLDHRKVAWIEALIGHPLVDVTHRIGGRSPDGIRRACQISLVHRALDCHVQAARSGITELKYD